MEATHPEQTPPQAAYSNTEFNFANGDPGKVKRILQRHQLKDRIKFLELVIRSHQPLIKAMQVTQKAYQEGFKEGLHQAIEAEKNACKTEAQAVQEPATSSGVQVSPPEAGRVEPLPIQEDQVVSDLPRASDELQKILTA